MKKSLLVAAMATLLLTGCNDQDKDDRAATSEAAGTNAVSNAATQNEDMLDKARDAGSKAWQATKETTGEVVEGSKEMADSAVDKTKEAASTVASASGKAVETMKEKATEVYEQVREKAGEMIEGARQKMGSDTPQAPTMPEKS